MRTASWSRSGRIVSLARTPGSPLELPWADQAAWAEERARAVRAAAVRSTTSATRVAAAMPLAIAADEPAGPDASADAGAVDSDLLALAVDAGLA